MEQEDSSYELELSKEDSEIEPSAERAVERCRLIYDSIGPEVGCVFVEANMVLTLADCRGQTETPIWNPDDIDRKEVEDLKKLSIEGVRSSSSEGKRPQFGPYINLDVESLAGYEIATKNRKIPGILPFRAAEGWAGFDKWRKETLRALEFCKENGSFPPYSNVAHLYHGIVKGYPDEAVLDADAYYGVLRKIGKKSATSRIPLAKYYGGAQPLYTYLPKTEGSLDILEHERDWQKVLEEFYASEWHRQIAVTPAFIKARETNHEKDNRWKFKKHITEK
ncbi:MAG: hypothetical protein A3C11_00975 [Candidatus Sungbacteria bacterium RIFCSPHIGHO2_02_FULL_49_12]|uniref:Uncharacterized protein n=1 Tax=Candidatus Sungbacteria bacterium RIFCSPHIGHO2_02_FULL_49_12 TaxID=1802271 RepID=A0A1G2KNS4_9BACT|nr:MAG: hypothetical protein A3C11_00975 [Candidatus Sungbacteria bacterium RIFCSPHIGHO2_02_FULL_49_12]